MDGYSAVLLAALVATTGAVAAALARRFRARRPRLTVIRALAATGGVLAAVALGAHWFLGHAPGDGAAMPVAEFVAAHPAPWMALAGAVLAFVLARRGGSTDG